MQFEYVSFPIGKGTSAVGICALCYIGNLFGVVGFCSSWFDWGIHLTRVSSISETDSV